MKNICILLFLLQIFGLSAQESPKKKLPFSENVIEILSRLETDYHIKFSYPTAIVEKEKVPLNSKVSSLEETILEIQNHTNLSIKKIDERYYIIMANDTVDICGYLLDNIDGKPIVGASILNGKANMGTISKKDGFFILKNVNIRDTLEVSFLGYSHIRLLPKKNKNDFCVTYKLVGENIILDEVVAQDDLTLGSLTSEEGAIVIEPKTFGTLSGSFEPDIVQNLQLLPGIDSPSETASGLYLRGGTPDQNLILWDGIKLYNTDHFFGSLSIFNPFITKKVELFQNGVKSEYGDRVAGVIDIQTDNNVDKLQGGFGVNFTHSDVYLKAPLAKGIGLVASVRKSLTELLETPTAKNFSRKVLRFTSLNEVENSFGDTSINDQSFNFIDANLKVIFNPSEKDSLSIASIVTRNGVESYFGLPDRSITFSDKVNVENIGSVIHWKRNLSDKLISKLESSYSGYNLRYDGSSEFNSSDFEGFKGNRYNKISEIGIKVHTDWKINSSLQLSQGYQFLNSKVDLNISDDFREINNQIQNISHALYNQISFDDSKSWYLNLGLRWNWYRNLKNTQIEPRVYVTKKIGDYLRIKGSAEYRSQTLSQVMQIGSPSFGLEDDIWIAATQENIPLIRSRQHSIGLLLNKNRYKIDIDFYHKKVDGITSLTNGFQFGVTGSMLSDLFVGRSETRGANVLLQKRFANHLGLIGYTYSKTDYTFDELNDGITFRGNNDITHSLNLSYAFQLEKVQFSLAWKYRTGIPFTNLIASEVISFDDSDAEGQIFLLDKLNGERLSDYHRLDFSAWYKFYWSKKQKDIRGKLGFTILNLYDRENILQRRVINAGTSTEPNISNLDSSALGLTPNIFFRVDF